MSKEVIEKLCDIEKWLLKQVDQEMLCEGTFCSSEEVAVAGEVIDMVKDIAEAKEKCIKAKYYETVVKAMEEYDEEDSEEVMGYNPNRYADGRYAPSGRGRRGYHPMPIYMGDVIADDMRGYTPTRGGSNNGNMSSSNNLVGTPSGRSGYRDGMMYDGDYMPPSERGQHYDNYRMAKRNYTETRSEADKKRMREHADEYVTNTVAAMLEIWNSADPEQKQHIKSNMTPLINGLNS